MRAPSQHEPPTDRPGSLLLRTLTPLVALLAVLAPLAASPALATTEPPIPAPGQVVPPHAAGGWPTETTGDDKIPPRSPEQQKRLDEISGELKKIAGTHGPDAVVLQAKLLIRAIAAGAVGPTEVRVAGPSAVAGPDHLEIEVETGLYFVEEETTAASRVDRVWEELALPVLDTMGSFAIEPQSLELVFLFDVQSSRFLVAGEYDLTAEARHESFRARLDRSLLEDLVTDDVSGEDVRERVQFGEAETVAALSDPTGRADPAP